MSLIENFVQNHVDLLKRNDYIDPSLYKELGVKSGLRNEDGKGVLAGLTNISQIISEKNVDGKKQPCDGLQRRPLLYARCAAVTLYCVFCHRAYRRLVRAPAGRVDHVQQNHPPRL